jgi:hypothetical protein
MAHIYALAGMAGVNHAYHPAHDYGVDGQFDSVVIRGNRRVTSGHPLAFQAKASVDWELVDGQIVYDLKAKNYDDIVTRHPSEVTMILILLCMPKDRTVWHLATSDVTVLRNCCYWAILAGVQCGYASTKRIHIPAANVLTPDSLLDLMAAEKVRRQTQWP